MTRRKQGAAQPAPAPLRLPPAPPGPPKPTESYRFTLAEASAVQAMVRGEASADQQLRVLDLVINKLARTYDLSYRPDSDRDTAFAEGGRFVGLQLVTMTKVSVDALEKQERAAKNPPAR